MSTGYIDSATITDAIGSLVVYESYNEWNKWISQSIIDVTTLLITNDQLKIAPAPYRGTTVSPSAESKWFFCYDMALKSLREIIPRRYPEKYQDADILFVKAKFNDWLNNNIDEIQKAIIKTKKEDSYDGWIQLAVKEAWLDDSVRSKGLFEKNMINYFSPILGVPREDLEHLHEKTNDIRQIKEWSAGENLNRNFDLAEDAYVASVILRGRYHYDVAEVKRESIMNHPIRQYVLPSLTKGTEHAIPKYMDYFISIIIASAMIENDRVKRSTLWLENIIKAREGFMQEKLKQTLDQYQELKGEEALDMAIDTAQKLKLRTHPKYLEYIFEFMAVTGIFVAGFYLNLGFGEISTLAATYGRIYLEKKSKKTFGKYVLEELTLDRESLRTLATALPGRIIRKE